jgi:hypothetical protein
MDTWGSLLSWGKATGREADCWHPCSVEIKTVDLYHHSLNPREMLHLITNTALPLSYQFRMNQLAQAVPLLIFLNPSRQILE